MYNDVQGVILLHRDWQGPLLFAPQLGEREDRTGGSEWGRQVIPAQLHWGNYGKRQKEQFSEDIPATNGFQLRFKKIRINHHLLVNLAVWDASGDRMTQYIQEGKLRLFDGILYVYDLTNPHSLIQMQQLYE